MGIAMPKPQSADTVLKFWFDEITPEQWFKKDADFDNSIRDRFGPTIEAALSARLTVGRTQLRMPCPYHYSGSVHA